MLRHDAARSPLARAPGRALPYDPEWRAEIRGRREAPATDAELVGGEPSAEALASALLTALAAGDDDRLAGLLVNQEEFRGIFWPEFPASRPYVKVPWQDAWRLHLASCGEHVREAMDDFRGSAFDLETVELPQRVEYRNFTMFRDVVLHVRDASSGVETSLLCVPILVERHGRWKAYIFGKNARG
jgi:hypothetical protein